MRDEFERNLESGLRLIAERAPVAPPDLTTRIRARRTRAWWWRLLAAALTTGAVAGTGSIVTAGGSVERDVPPPATYRPIEQVHPDALHEIPATMPDGRPYYVVGMIDRGHALLQSFPDKRAHQPDGLWSLDVATGLPTRLVKVSVPKGTVVNSWTAVIGGGRLAWWTARRVKGKMTTTFFTAPVTGGEQRAIAEAPGYPLDLVIDDGRLIWTRSGTGGAYEMPLTGGTPRPIENTEGLHMLHWPWLGRPAFRPNGPSIVEFAEIVNVLTGERRTAPAWEPATSCSITWCVRGDHVGHRDGTATRVSPNWAIRPPALDRFLLLTTPWSNRFHLLEDLTTGVITELNPDDNPSIHLRATTLTYRRGDHMVLVDLTAID
ncbi:hypothetical protein Aph01nite_32680 [Acrocarpospora phusangensis]|uniref:Uncharacterized protein n=1 Tax=Acrocarpospora phusangensis TaxID=1070424 RepID=A0A919QCL8_9ACTN|nr:hypothetical protein [Acrocarpospora phusangensis]GIH24958.1 hypothetical protein Aph01nite_32680 [Acrocarpospora phusangensis]